MNTTPLLFLVRFVQSVHFAYPEGALFVLFAVCVCGILSVALVVVEWRHSRTILISQRTGIVWRFGLLTRLAKAGALCGMIAAGLFSLAMPFRAIVTPYKEFQGGCYGFGLDVSLSMLAHAETPEGVSRTKEGAPKTRLSLAQEQVADVVTSLVEGDKFALMVFARESVFFEPMWTADKSQFLSQVGSVSPSYVDVNGRGGTNIPQALQMLTGAFPVQEKCEMFVILFTDGEPEGDEKDLGQALLDALDDFRREERRPKVFVVAVGNPDTPMRIRKYDASGNLIGFEVNDEGSYILSQPDIRYLRDTSRGFGAQLFYAGRDTEELTRALEEAVEAARTVVVVREREDIVSLAPHLAALFLVCFVIFTLAEFRRKRNRR